MNEFSSGGPNPWNIYTSTDPNPSYQTQTGGGIIGHQEGQQPIKSSSSVGGTSAVSAISFGFVATAILIAMFLVMALFEHLLRPRRSSQDDAAAEDGSLESGQAQDGMHVTEKLRSPQDVSTSYSSMDISVLMPGQNCPTFIAQPAPLIPCRREGIHWPSYI
ncbi:hypothetical protein BVC80_8847g29 [Macleaya cordata]|uniref:Uncharacterized protein n=1 Tax=Macleaya cordata TaxID=56857 RepID=A0A200PZX6_MACCD|nr:hypothetical protein BVC80_8847g29 [Macleaya cordata]